MRDGILYDPIEDDPKARLLVEAAEKEAKEELDAKGVKMRMGYCHELWAVQKTDLARETPA